MKKVNEVELRTVDGGLRIPLGRLMLDVSLLKASELDGGKYLGVALYQRLSYSFNYVFYFGYWFKDGFYTFFNTNFSYAKEINSPLPIDKL